MFNFFQSSKSTQFLTSRLFDEKSFYPKFTQDLLSCQKEVIIESPYITVERMKRFSAVFETLLRRNVEIYIVTRRPEEHEPFLQQQAEAEIRRFETMGVHTLLCIGNHHRKLAILDRKILWEGSLNILSQTHSREIMRRIEGEKTATEMFEFLKLGKYIE